MRLLIIGATGFIGSHLVSVATAQNMEVIVLSRSGILPEGAMDAFAWSFGQSVPEGAYTDVDCAIHLAHDFNGVDGAQLTIESTLAISSQLQAAGIQRQLFFSSYSAGKYATSLYGRTKFTLEQALAEQTSLVIVRPGLVLGDGGIYGRIRKLAQILPFIPLPDGGRGNVSVIKIEKLCELTLQIALDLHPPPEANLFQHKLTSLRELVLEAAAETGCQPWILPIPGTLMISALKLVAQLRIPLPVNADNLIGFMANQSAQHISTLNKDSIT